MSVLAQVADLVRRRVPRFRIGTHNLHDAAGRPVMFADVLIFTEAVAARVRAVARTRPTRRVIVCEQQRSLVVVLNRLLFAVESTHYRQAHAGLAGVTPDRGTFVVLARIRFTRVRIAIIAEHRINAAFGPYVRGEAEFRSACWDHHTALTLAWVAELEAAGYVVLAGGDLNTPHDVHGYEHRLQEVSTSYDRLGCSRSVHDSDRRRVRRVRALLADFDRGPRRGSDHEEISAAVNLTVDEWKAAA